MNGWSNSCYIIPGEHEGEWYVMSEGKLKAATTNYGIAKRMMKEENQRMNRDVIRQLEKRHKLNERLTIATEHMGRAELVAFLTSNYTVQELEEHILPLVEHQAVS